ncbi:TolC family protein [Mucilaginibacter sp. UR6-11]|uniref:TolC family protein n=1 Tax=Mucilaginibacter sp. UR6-11 TaxID=1435644 RepID=UPI001E2C3A7D|nr:TolC family protein [Mucilaginibacter sp. UR6-11]MCC8426232.1 TolC family protein [Mucilaginibacter sp. UR6-11]
MKKTSFLLIINFILFFNTSAIFAQKSIDTIPNVITLKQSILFALRNQPAVRQAAIDEQINERDIRIGLSGWLPQLNSAGSYTHYFKGSPVASTTPGVVSSIDEYSSLGLQASQVIYNNDVLLASKTANYSRLYYKQNTVSSQINVVADVSKAFFDVLLSQKQLNIINEDIVRLQRSLKDAYNRYQAGVVDKIDYKQATIALNNEIALRKQTAETINGKQAYLKQIMGVNPQFGITLAYDSTSYEREAYIDTNQMVNVNNRIEYQLLQTEKNLKNLNVNYYRWGFLPSLSAVGSYNLVYLNTRFSDLYSNAFPSGYAGLSLTLPIFQGTKRLQNLSKARLEVERTDLDVVNSQNTINTQYIQALASYKSNYTNWQLLKQNVALAKDVYNVVSLQYREGVKTYLDVIVAQSDLRTSELNYYNALFQVLSSKIDLKKALGTLTVDTTINNNNE